MPGAAYQLMICSYVMYHNEKTFLETEAIGTATETINWETKILKHNNWGRAFSVIISPILGPLANFAGHVICDLLRQAPTRSSSVR